MLDKVYCVLPLLEKVVRETYKECPMQIFEISNAHSMRQGEGKRAKTPEPKFIRLGQIEHPFSCRKHLMREG